MEVSVKRSAVISECGLYRYRLDRELLETGIVIAFFGVNPSTADASAEDATTRKWYGFSVRQFARKYIAVNPFAFRSTDVNALAGAADPIGPDNDRHIDEVIKEADLLVPCWGSTDKVPPRLRYRFVEIFERLFDSNKPVKIFGLTKGGDPKHPLMLGYSTPLKCAFRTAFRQLKTQNRELKTSQERTWPE